MLVPAQCRAARTLIGLPQLALAREARVALHTLIDFERGRRTPRLATLQAITAALERPGIELIAENGGGVGARVRVPGTEHRPKPRQCAGRTSGVRALR